MLVIKYELDSGSILTDMLIYNSYFTKPTQINYHFFNIKIYSCAAIVLKRLLLRVISLL